MSILIERRKQAIFSHSRGKLEQAAEGYASVLAEDSDDVETLFMFGMLEGQRSNFEKSAELLGRALALDPNYKDCRLYFGLALRAAGKPREALEQIDILLSAEPANADALVAKASALVDLKETDRAIETLNQLVAAHPKNAAAWTERGNILYARGDVEGALESYQRARALDPTVPEHHLQEGRAFLHLKRYQEARAAFDKAVQINPSFVDAHLGRATAMLRLHNVVAAMLSAEKARQLDPKSASAHFIMGCGQLELGHLSEALDFFDQTVQLDPTHAESHFARGETLQKLGRFTEAEESFREASRHNPRLSMAKGNQLHARLENCDWREYSKLCSEVSLSIAQGHPAINPLAFQAICTDESLLKKCAENITRSFYLPSKERLARETQTRNEKIRVGYVGGDFCGSLNGQALGALFSLHDRSRFEIFVFDSGLGDGSETRKKIESAVDKFFVIADISDSEAANRIAALNLDILVNLTGFSEHARPGIFAMRPCNIQVTYGFPGTLGAEYIDYLVCDPSYISKESLPHYCEEVIHIPEHAYAAFPFDATSDIDASSGIVESRSEHGLDASSFVFACFQTGVRISPDQFSTWMKILSRVSDSVLWMLEGSSSATENLKKAATEAGIDSNRLIFAPRVPPEEHVRRYLVADLFLDTHPCSSADPLYTGAPMVTLEGGAMPGRAAAGILKSLGLNEWVAKTPKEYENLAVSLAEDRHLISSYRRSLGNAIASSALFSHQRLAGNLENAFLSMIARADKDLRLEGG